MIDFITVAWHGMDTHDIKSVTFVYIFLCFFINISINGSDFKSKKEEKINKGRESGENHIICDALSIIQYIIEYCQRASYITIYFMILKLDLTFYSTVRF